MKAALALLVLGLCLALPARAGAQATLLGSVNGSFEITLKTTGGETVTQLPAGSYTILVTDSTTGHNFHLHGPGVDEATQVAAVESKTWTVTFVDGVYAFNCDRHPGSMYGSFTVGNVLTVSKIGAGFGTVTSTPAGIYCGGTCAASFPLGELVTLAAAPVAGSAFGGWGGACSGADCALSPSIPTEVSARFTLAPTPPPPPPPPPATAPARVTKVTVRRRSGRRYVRIRLAVTRHAAASAALLRRGSKVAGRSAHLAPGSRVLEVRAPRDASGSYRLRLTLTDAATNDAYVVRRKVRL